MRTATLTSLLVLVLVTVGCEAGGGAAADAGGVPDTAAADGSGGPGCGPYPTPPAGAGTPIHVAADCADGPPDGSAERPYRTITAALAVAVPGATILVAAGEYPEALRIEVTPLAIVGMVDEATGVPRTVLRPPATADSAGGVFLLGPGGSPPESVALTGLTVRGAGTAGFWASGQSVALTRCRVEGARAVAAEGQPEAVYGYGVLATDGADVVVRDSAIVDCDGAGVLLVAASGRVTGSEIAGNGRGGVRLERCVDAAVVLEGNRLDANRELGIGVFGSAAEVRGNEVLGTRADALGTADGVVVAGLDDGTAATALVEGNTVSGCVRVGILITDGGGGTVDGNTVSDNDHAGIWAQAVGDGRTDALVISGNAVSGNRYVGIAATLGAAARVLGNEVSGTRPGPTYADGDVVQVAYGVGVFAGALAEVRDTALGAFDAAADEAQVAHVLVDAGDAATVVRGNHAVEAGAPLVIAVQHQPTGEVTVAANPDASVERYGPDEGRYALEASMSGGVAVDERAAGDL